MIKKKLNGLSYFCFEKLSEFSEIKHGVFTRKGGVSSGVCEGLNVGIVPDDYDRNVRKNRELILKTFDGNYIVSTKQTHSKDVFTAKEEFDTGKGIEADASITDQKGACLLIKTADCQAVILYDPVKKVIGNIHSGWRGSVANIIGETVSKMVKEFGSNPENIIAGIGPSLGPCCAEFKNYRDELPEKYWKYHTENNHFDFWQISIDQLLDSGLFDENIEKSDICTKCNPDLFYSYRYENNTGRFGTAVMIKG